LVHGRPDVRHGLDRGVRTRRPRLHRRRLLEEPLRAIRIGQVGDQREPAARLVLDGVARDAQLRLLLRPRTEPTRDRAALLFAGLADSLFWGDVGKYEQIEATDIFVIKFVEK